jgi:hypothetical protein
LDGQNQRAELDRGLAWSAHCLTRWGDQSRRITPDIFDHILPFTFLDAVTLGETVEKLAYSDLN